MNAMHIRGVCARETCNARPARAPGAFPLLVCAHARACNCEPLCAPTLTVTTTPPALAPCFPPLPARVYAHRSTDLCSALLPVPPPAQLQAQAGCRVSRRRGVRASTFAVRTSLRAALLRARVGFTRVRRGRAGQAGLVEEATRNYSLSAALPSALRLRRHR